jgi:hypothetical protein
MVIKWETGQSKNQEVENNHCTYDLSECYQAKIVPVIRNISSSTGYTSGGQVLTIDGVGFGEDFDDIDISVGQAKCKP